MSLSVNVHATGRFEPVTFRAEGITSSATGDLMLDIDTMYAGAQTADVTLFLSPTTARNLVACLAGFLGLRVEEPIGPSGHEAIAETERQLGVGRDE